MGGQSSERDVSLRTGHAVHQALLRRGYYAVAIDVDESIDIQLRENRDRVRGPAWSWRIRRYYTRSPGTRSLSLYRVRRQS